MGGKTSTSTSNVSIPPEVLARYNAINTRAETAANKPFQAFGNNAADYVAQMNAQQAAGTNTINANTGPASAGIDPYITSYTKNVADTTGAYLKQQQEQAQSGALGTAVQSGAFGGDRAGVAAANLQQQNQMAYGKTMADIMNQGYTQALGASQADLNRGLQAGQMQLAAGTMQQQTEQAGKDAMINRFMQEQGLPYQQAQFLANIALGTGVASGSTTTTTQPIGFFQNLATGGKVDGYAEGGGVAGPVSHSKEAIGGLGYVPEPNLPIGDLMIAKPPEQQDNNGGDIVAKVLAMIGGGGKAEGGSVVRPSLPKEMGRLIPEPSEPVNFMDSRQAKTIAAIPRALLEALNIISADGHAARAEKPIDRETIGREIRGGEKMNEFYGQVEDMKQAIDRKLLGPIASGYNSVGSGVSSRLADLFGTLGDDMVQKTYQDLAGESADKALRYYNEGIFSPKAATLGEIEDRKELAHLTRYASGGVAGGRHGYATDGYVGPNSREEALARYDVLPKVGRTENLANDLLIALGKQPLNDNYMPPRGGVSPAFEMPDRPISLTPPTGVSNLGQTTRKGEDNYFKMIENPTKGQVLDYGISQGRTPTGNFMPPRGMPDRPISLTPRSGLAPTESPIPLARPAGLAGGADVAADTMAVLGNTPAATGVVAPTVATGVVAPTAVAPQASPKTNTGEIPQGGYTPIVSTETQVQFQLQEPEYQEYRNTPYATAADAATGMDVLVERSGGAGRKEAAMYAESVAEAAQNGDFSKLPPNVGKIYNQLISEGVSPIHAAGTVGRYMVESYVHIDPNARNTLGGGMGTYGIAQWRGDRMKALAEFAGVPLESLANAPVSTPEGRYYSTGADYSGGLGGTRTDAAGAPMGGVKPYEDRNAVGKFFNNPEGGLNRNALLSLLSGLGTMASSRSRSPFTAILQGLGGGAETYKDLLKQNADIDFTNAQTANQGVQLFKNSIYYNEALGQTFVPLQGGGVQTFADFMVKPAGASMAGVAADQVMRSIAGGAESRGVDLATATPEQIFGGGVAPSAAPMDQGAAPQTPAAGMPVPQVIVPYAPLGTFALDDKDQAYIQQAEARSRSAITPQDRENLNNQAAATRAAADNGTASAGMSFRNMNELAVTVAKAAKDNNLGPLTEYKAYFEARAGQIARQFNIPYNGNATTTQALLNKLSSLSADQMTADTAAASLYLQNKGIFPGIDTDPIAAAEITSEMMTKNMAAYEKGQFINDIYRAQNGTVKDLTGVDTLFNDKVGTLYQVEKTNIADLLKYAGDTRGDAELRQLVVDFFDSANRGAFENQTEAQMALEEIFGAMYANSPEQHRVSESLGRYFVQQGNS